MQAISRFEAFYIAVCWFPTEFFDWLVGLWGDGFVDVPDQIISLLISHIIQHRSIVLDLEHNVINIKANHNDNYDWVPPVLAFGSCLLVGYQTAHERHEEKSETFNDGELNVECRVARVVFIEVNAHHDNKVNVDNCEKVGYNELGLGLYQLF